MLMLLLISVVTFVGTFLPIYAIFRFPVPAEPPVHRRIAAAVGQRRDTLFENRVLAPIMAFGLTLARRFSVTSLRRRVRQDLDAAGNPSGYSVEEYLALCIVCGFAVAVGLSAVDIFLGGTEALLILPIFAVIGFWVPIFALRSSAQKRVARISKQLPYTLDLVALVMAAGSSFTEAVETLIRDAPDDDLNQELQIALREIEFGTTRAQALANVAERIPLESLRSVVGAVNQAERLGTPLAQILKLQADMMRMHRGVRAEKLSASASLRILLPSMIILVAVVVIVFAPMLIMYFRGELF